MRAGGAQEKAGGAGVLGGEMQAPGGDRRKLAHLAQNGGEAGSAQTFLHGPQDFLVVAPAKDDQPPRRQAEGTEPVAVKIPAALAPKDRCPGVRMGNTGEQGGTKTGGRHIAGHFVQSAQGQAAPGQAGIDGRGAGGNRFRRRAPGGGRLQSPDGAA